MQFYKLERSEMSRILTSTIFTICMSVFSLGANAADALLECQIENMDTVVKIEKSMFGGKKVHFNTKGDWVEREVLKQNDTYIWVKSDFVWSWTDETSCKVDECSYDFQLELIEHERKSGKYLYIHRIADAPCNAKLYGECKPLNTGDRLESIRCKVVQPFQ